MARDQKATSRRRRETGATGGAAKPRGRSATESRERAQVVRWATVPVPVGVRMATPHLHMPRVDVRSSAMTGAALAGRAVGAVRASLPERRQMAYYGALGAMAAFGALEWPVAAAIGAGVWVASRTGGPASQAERAQGRGAGTPARSSSGGRRR